MPQSTHARLIPTGFLVTDGTVHRKSTFLVLQCDGHKAVASDKGKELGDVKLTHLCTVGGPKEKIITMRKT